MVVRVSREILIEAPMEAIIDALADVDAMPSWSSMHKHVDVVDRYPDGRPHHVRAAIKLLGFADEEILEFHWGPDWVVWDADRTAHQRGLHVEFTLSQDVLDGTTRVRVHITAEPATLIPDFMIKRASRTVLEEATAGLRNRVLTGKASDPPE
jgi:uncharacterized membrane protein